MSKFKSGRPKNVAWPSQFDFFPVWNKIAEGKDKIWEHAQPQQKNQDFF